jgi:hypothetical protein
MRGMVGGTDARGNGCEKSALRQKKMSFQELLKKKNQKHDKIKSRN